MIYKTNIKANKIYIGNNPISSVFSGEDLVFNDYIFNGYECIMHLDGNDAPVNNYWVDRIYGKQWGLYNGAYYNSETKQYCFDTTNAYAQLVSPTFSLGNHWGIHISCEAKLGNYGVCVDFGSVTHASKAVGVMYGTNESGSTGNPWSTPNSLTYNWKMKGNDSNPGVYIISDKFVELNTTDFVKVDIISQIIDKGNGYDMMRGSVNGSQLLTCDVDIPKVLYEGLGTPWKINQGVAGSAYAGMGRYNFIKVFKID